MAQDVLTIAWKLMRRRKFATAIKMLEARLEVYEGNFEYYLILGIACLYVGDIGAASSYFQYARKIKITDTRLMLGQAAIFLRHGDTDRALQYYMDIKDNDPGNKTANDAIEFIRYKGDYDTICRWVDTGRIEQFYPALGVNPEKIAAVVIPVCALLLGCAVAFTLVPKRIKYYDGDRLELAKLEPLVLTDSEKHNLQEKDLSTQSYRYILNDKEIKTSYESALRYFQARRDNASQIEVNRLLNSNASLAIKQKAVSICTYYDVPSFDTLTDSPSYKDVEADPALYLDCWVSWGGKISNASLNPDGSYVCQLLVGYESGVVVEGIVTVRFDRAPVVAADQAVRILGKISSEDNKIYLKGTAVYQSVKDGML